MNKKIKAQITVYAALSVFLVMTLVCTCIRSAAVSAGRVKMEMASVLSMEAVFAGYSRELLEEFDIFALPESDNLQKVFLQYLKKNTQNADEGETAQNGEGTQVLAGRLDSFVHMTDDNGTHINQEILSYMRYGVFQVAQDMILGQEDLKKQKEQSKALHEITQEIGKCEEAFCEQEETVLGITESVREISVDNALQCISDLKEDIEVYEEAVQEDDTQTVQEYYERNCEALEKELADLQESIQTALTRIQTYEECREKAQKQAEECRSKTEQKREKLNADVYDSLIQDIDSFAQEDSSDEQGKITAVRAALYENHDRAQGFLQDKEELPGELSPQNSAGAEEVLDGMKEELPKISGEELVSRYFDIAAEAPQEREGLTGVKNVLNRLKGTLAERVTGQELSDKSISYENLADSLYRRELRGETAGPADKILYDEYLFMKFASYTDYLKEDKTLETQTQNRLDYVLEYILYGKNSDKENLWQGMEELALFREGVNMAYLLTDSQKKAEAYALAASLVGFTGNPAAVKAAQYVILGVWAYGESVVELKQLYRGSRIKPVKTGENWQLSLQALLSMNLEREYDEEDGLSYEDYLKVLMLLQNDSQKYYRTMAAMELRMIELGDTGFRMKDYIYGAESRVVFKIGAIQQNYEKTCSYHYG